MYRFLKIIFILLFLIPAIRVNAADNVSVILKKAKARVDSIRNYEADMTITRKGSVPKNKRKIRKAHLYYTAKALRVEMKEPSGGVYLFKGDKKYELDKQNNKSSDSKYISPDFKAQEPLGGILFLLSYADKAKDKKISSEGGMYQIIFKTAINSIEILISRKGYLVKKVLSFIDSEQVTEVSLDYEKIGKYYFPVKKNSAIFMGKKREETVILLKNVKVNNRVDKGLFRVGK